MIDFDALLRNYDQILEFARTADEIANFLWQGDEVAKENFCCELRKVMLQRLEKNVT